jgi:hypothetical protein
MSMAEDNKREISWNEHRFKTLHKKLTAEDEFTAGWKAHSKEMEKTNDK